VNIDIVDIYALTEKLNCNHTRTADGRHYQTDAYFSALKELIVSKSMAVN
jgi:hypothetical protein